MGAVNFGRLINKNNLALVNEPESQEEQEEQDFFNYELEEVEEELKNRKAKAGQSYECFPDLPFEPVMAELFRNFIILI